MGYFNFRFTIRNFYPLYKIVSNSDTFNFNNTTISMVKKLYFF